MTFLEAPSSKHTALHYAGVADVAGAHKQTDKE